MAEGQLHDNEVGNRRRVASTDFRTETENNSHEDPNRRRHVRFRLARTRRAPWSPPSRHSATKNPRRFSAKPSRCCSPATTCSGQAATGTGKTAAFALPLLNKLSEDTKTNRGKARALVLVPTRELAMQVAEALHKYAKGSNLNVVPVYGGAPMDHQIRALRRGAEVVVGTPGRVLDHLRRQTLNLATVEMLVLDEADEMLDMGFAEDIDAIVAETPDTRQTALFAATFAPRILSIAGKHLKTPEEGADRAGEARARQAAPGPPGRLHRRHAARRPARSAASSISRARSRRSSSAARASRSMSSPTR